MIRCIKTFERDDHTLVVDTTSGVRVVTRVPKGEQYSPPARPVVGPSLPRKAMNFAKAAAVHVADGGRLVSDDVVKQRYEICSSNACGLFQPTLGTSQEGTCQHISCGCALKTVGVDGRNKLRWASSNCPVGLWTAVNSDDPQPAATDGT